MIPTLGRPRENFCAFEAKLGRLHRELRASLDYIARPCLKRKKEYTYKYKTLPTLSSYKYTEKERGEGERDTSLDVF